jgi:hypothetical protein
MQGDERDVLGHPAGSVNAESWRNEDEAVDAAVANLGDAPLRLFPALQHEDGHRLPVRRRAFDDAAQDFHEVEVGSLFPVVGDDADGIGPPVREGASRGVGAVVQPFGGGNDARPGLGRGPRRRLRAVQHHGGGHHRHIRLAGDIGQCGDAAAATSFRGKR